MFERFKAGLQHRYNNNPTTINRDGETLKLPIDWYDFQTLVLTNEQRQLTREAYYQHDDHTAFRYLFKPNHWISEQAKYVEISDNREERWASFQEYIPLIAYFWIAAADENTPSTVGHTIEARKEFFIKQIPLTAPPITGIKQERSCRKMARNGKKSMMI